MTSHTGKPTIRIQTSTPATKIKLFMFPSLKGRGFTLSPAMLSGNSPIAISLINSNLLAVADNSELPPLHNPPLFYQLHCLGPVHNFVRVMEHKAAPVPQKSCILRGYVLNFVMVVRHLKLSCSCYLSALCRLTTYTVPQYG